MKPLTRVVSICAASILLLATGCGSSTNSPVPGPSFTLYAVQNDNQSSTVGNSVLEFPANVSGSIAATNSVTVPMQTGYDAVAVDTAGNLYVSASVTTFPTLYEILVYAAGATGSTTPARTITSSSFSTFISSIAVDSTGDVYALSGNSISVFATDAAANAIPVRQIAGTLTQLNSASAIAVDAAQNIYVANAQANDILVFSSTETGNVSPAGVLTGTATEIGSPSGVAVDSSGDLYVASYNQPSNSSLVLEFAPGATGNAAPSKMLTAIAADTLGGLAVDALDNLYVCTAASGQLAIAVYSSGETGSNIPVKTISSTAWTTFTYGQIAVR